MGLISLVYVSIAAAEMSQDKLLEILETSRRNNAARNVTGMLLYRGRFFVQALEGEEYDVMTTYAKIAADPRHYNVLIVEKVPIETRSFAGWLMGFHYIDDEFLAKTPGFTNYLQQPFTPDHFAERPSKAKLMLETFRNGTYF